MSPSPASPAGQVHSHHKYATQETLHSSSSPMSNDKEAHYSSIAIYIHYTGPNGVRTCPDGNTEDKDNTQQR